MSNIYMPTKGPEDWKQFLAEPDKQWKDGYSAKSLADCWEASKPHLPQEITRCLNISRNEKLHNLNMILGIPELKVDLPPKGGRPSQTDLFALCENEEGLVPIAIEGKVGESFGPTVEERLMGASKGVLERMEYLCKELALSQDSLSSIRYQLLHRTVSALILAKRFHAKTAAMIVHSFSERDSSFDDFCAFVALFNQVAKVNHSVSLGEFNGVELFVGWARGSNTKA